MVSNHFYYISNFRVTKFEIFKSIQQTLVQVWDNIGKNNFTFNNGELFFFLVVTPTGLIMRLLRKDILSLKYNQNKSYWIEKNGPKSKMKNQF